MFGSLVIRLGVSALTITLAACGTQANGRSTVNVNVHGVNYSGTAFSYGVVDPAKPDSSGTGELVSPYAGGGTVCCFTLPKEWRQGIKVKVFSTHWLQKRPDGSLPEVTNVHVVDVPPYVDGKPGELWVMRGEDGVMSVVSSDFQPDHGRWPGAIKGWPVPSLEYARQRWEITRNHEEGGVRLYADLLAQLDREPGKQAMEAWQSDQRFRPASLKGFSGPDDPRYMDSLKERYVNGLQYAKQLLEKVMDARP